MSMTVTPGRSPTAGSTSRGTARSRTTTGTFTCAEVITWPVAAVEAIVASEIDAYRIVRRGLDVAPTVAALRARAEDVVAAELARLRQRRPELTDEERADVALTVHRVVQRLLHQPTVRVRQLAAEPGGVHYAQVLRELFGLDVLPGAETVADVPSDVYPRESDDPRDADVFGGDVDVFPRDVDGHPGGSINDAGGERP
jgi:glutamyl-tRNA reductase